MKKFVLRRLLMAIATMWVIITITFVMMHSIPGDPFAKEGKMPERVYENLRAQYGLDKPLAEQYVIYLKNIVRGDFGQSMKSQAETVNQMIRRGAPVSAQIGLQAFVVAMILGPALGSIAALYQNKWPDYVTMIIAIIGISVPSFIFATLLVQFVAKNVAWLPISGWGEFRHSILPSLALALMPMASSARLMRSSMLEVLGQDYIRTARSKGLSQFKVIMNHAVRNAILPVVSTLGTTLSGLLTGSFVIEKIFGVPGLGSFLISSITNRDYTLIMGTTIFYSAVLIVLLLIVDILYVVIDPRIQLTGGKR
ncbi:Oligopeptide transport system permease protein oppB [Aedoeadaptatus ivorii]|uniref:Oligopeptide transport system permease protein oppB n=1 Tax=Aedoeadaptatus ivorii TaxID=54006 RepID=A0A448V366_9FIRM|nr:ABC transporter permease [Peptoniphilus ivorii]MDQ0508264.1 ABC-type dipeptide/oligopeptide/nickel transport system permease component [Peptoniphilus ivorii]VEJ36238.1 Oligopeptide transport system permease protein oppB [Peptoniphilus ivorii]